VRSIKLYKRSYARGQYRKKSVRKRAVPLYGQVQPSNHLLSCRGEKTGLEVHGILGTGGVLQEKCERDGGNAVIAGNLLNFKRPPKRAMRISKKKEKRKKNVRASARGMRAVDRMAGSKQGLLARKEVANAEVSTRIEVSPTMRGCSRLKKEALKNRANRKKRAAVTHRESKTWFAQEPTT